MSETAGDEKERNIRAAIAGDPNDELPRTDACRFLLARIDALRARVEELERERAAMKSGAKAAR